jgi:DNA-binding IclR family transcriptional regulator
MTPAAFLELLPAQSRIFEAIASVDEITGSICDLAQQFGVAAGDFSVCLNELIAVGWVAAEPDADGRLRIRLQD